MTEDISRRDFLSGMTLTIASGLTPLSQLSAAERRYYPPSLCGLRGSGPGSFEVAHKLARDRESFDLSALPAEGHYDLVIVGGGISGLAAAWFYREAHGTSSRILILENHDDFGGHAKRNEFQVDARMLLGYGGSESLQSPRALFSPAVNRLLTALAIDILRFEAAYDRKLYASLGLSEGVFFDRETFGEDRLVSGNPVSEGAAATPGGNAHTKSVDEFAGSFPMSPEARAQLRMFFAAPGDYLNGKSKEDKIAHLKRTSYHGYLIDDAGLGREAVQYFQQRTCDFMALGADAVPAFDALNAGYPGFAGLGIAPENEAELTEPYIYHFPDGNASIARLLVRSLIPDTAPGHTMDDIVLADFDYSKLDMEGSSVRLRLNSTAVSARQDQGSVDIGYVAGGKLRRIKARHSILACYNMMIPFLVPDLPEEQKTALSLSVKAPLVYVNVAVRNWRPFIKLGVHEVYCPSAFFSLVKLDYPISLGGYRNPRSPDEPMVLHLVHTPNTPNQGLTADEQCRIGRKKLLEITFAHFEEQIKGQLNRMLGTGGFEASADIAAITVNRWPHGYAHAFNSLYEAKTDGPEPYEISRQPFGRIAIANSDAAWEAYLHAAIDQAWRAVGDLNGA